MRSTKKASRHSTKYLCAAVAGGGIAVMLGVFFYAPKITGVSFADWVATSTTTPPATLPLNKVEYDTRLLALAHVPPSSPWYEAFLQGTTTASTTTPRPEWPVRRVYPNAGALLPFNRIVAYYGNFYSTGMGILGEYPEAEVLARLQVEVDKWQAADPSTPVVPAIEYIDVTAQESPGRDGAYRLRMPDSQIDKAIAMAAKINGIVILDVQVGLSTLQEELPLLANYLAMPQVHLAIDPEFSMHNGERPGTVIGTVDASDVNYAARYLAQLVQEHSLPPKILVVHRFTGGMVTNASLIKPLPEVQVVMDMDGWGFPEKKENTYKRVITEDPVQFAGIKLFYKNDSRAPSTGLLSTTTVMSLMPAPIFIQYQ
ncbi:MAG: hypothetical protein AAB919_00075 [Patescibacteria group bacterium]